MSTQIIFRSGLDTIGGTIVEVIKNDDRLIFDFGTVFDPTSNNEVLPNVSGVYNDDSKYNDAILISHSHLDHIKALNLIHPNIDIYMSEMTNDLITTLIENGFDAISGEPRSYSSVKFEQTYQINNFNITFYPVDHDVIGASCILIENEDISILYTGDYRFSGRNNEFMQDLLAKLNKVDLVISEGVTYSFIEDDYEVIASNEVDSYETDYANDVIENNELDNYNNILFNTYIMGTERMESICELASKLNKDIYMFEFQYNIANKYLSKYSHLFKLISADSAIENCIVQFEFIERDKYVETYRNSILLQSGGEPLGDYDPRYADLIAYCTENNIIFNVCGLGGHAKPEHIKYFLNNIEHDYLVPLHSFKRYLIKSDNSKQLLVKTDEVLTFNKHQLVD